MPDSLAIEEKRALRRAQSVWRKERGATDSLIGGRRGLEIGRKDENLFLRAMREAFAWHFLGSEDFRRLCFAEQFFPWHLRRGTDLPRIPSFFVTVLKTHRVCSVKDDEIVLTLRSSGTAGQTSAIELDRTSLRRIARIVRHIYQDLGMVDQRKTNYLCFTYDPEVAKDVGTAFSDKLLTGLTRTAEVFYAIEWCDQHEDWHLSTERVGEALDRFEASGRPFRLLGFPAHTWTVLNELVERRGRPYRFGPRSYVLTGGGWKGFDGETIPPQRFRERVGQWLGIPMSNVRDLYGMVEHGVPYSECELHRMHVPRYSRVYVRDPRTLELLPYGRKGLLQFVTPYHRSYPAISLMTTDVGKLSPGCHCGRSSPVVELLGRGGVVKHQGCAIKALEVRAGD